MNREKKIALLKEVLKGDKPLSQILPKARLCMLEVEPGVFLDANSGRYISPDDLNSHIEAFKRNNAGKIIETAFAYNEEFERINAQLEAEY